LTYTLHANQFDFDSDATDQDMVVAQAYMCERKYWHSPYG